MKKQIRKEDIQSKLRWVIKTLLKAWFRVSVTGDYRPSPQAVIIANRTSVIDLLLLSVFLPEKLTVALHPNLYKKLWVRALSLFAEVVAIDPSTSHAVRVLIRNIRQGKRCVIFPQGLHGASSGDVRVFDGPGLVLQRASSVIVPIRIEGAEKSIFSILKDKYNWQWFPKITLHIEPTRILPIEASREVIGQHLFRLISDMTYNNYNTHQTLMSALIDGVKQGVRWHAKVEDSNRMPLNYRQLLMRVFILGRQIKRHTRKDEHVGVMMPTTLAGMVTFFALSLQRRIPAMINFTSGLFNIKSACQTAGINVIYTSRQFVDTAKLDDLIEGLSATAIKVVYLEDFKPQIGLTNKLAGLVKSYVPKLAYWAMGPKASPSDIGVILFTSGSEGVPKGVALAHRNIIANCYQMLARVDFTRNDKFFNSLPIFHCFGLTAGSILPLITGNRVFFYPSPLHYKVIPALVYENGSTVMFATDTFLTGYARAAQLHDFSTIRYIFAGAEKVKPETINHWAITFGARIYEGYGATEAAPVISLNCPSAIKQGSVGLPLTGIECRLVPVEGIEGAGRLMLRGPNVMLGYISKDNPNALVPMDEGWHDTGDIVSLEEGFIVIRGRAKRFAKLGGEMVSLTAVESVATTIWPEKLHAAITIPGAKGEHIVLYTEAEDADRNTFVKKLRELGQSELLVPYQIHPKFKVPVLSSGKIDYMTLQRLVKENTVIPSVARHPEYSEGSP